MFGSLKGKTICYVVSVARNRVMSIKAINPCSVRIAFGMPFRNFLQRLTATPNNGMSCISAPAAKELVNINVLDFPQLIALYAMGAGRYNRWVAAHPAPRYGLICQLVTE